MVYVVSYSMPDLFSAYRNGPVADCDGASFSGDKTEPYVHAATNQTLYFRGKRVLDAMLDTLLTEHSLNTAEEVLLSGGSAGGLSTYLHAGKEAPLRLQDRRAG